ncbi:MAG: N-acetylmuramoyl-L-alanine amidase [Candidatus Zixiibacteriota bacterium]|nr:MAG: N-acetylmuramoyl-L-alanine amidase [candidate division Zixibacteria bacterium]
MRYKAVFIIFILLYSVASADIDINIIYPRFDQQLPAVDSTFIFGNVTPGSGLLINGYPVKVHRDGGWLAFLPVQRGHFEFNIIAIGQTDTALIVWPVQVGPAALIDIGLRPLIPNTPDPDSDVVYSVGDIFHFSFKAPGGGSGWFKIGDSDSISMYEVNRNEYHTPNSVFGDISVGNNYRSDLVVYAGYHHLSDEDIGNHAIEYWFNSGGFSEGYLQDTHRRSTGKILTVMPEFPPVVGELSGKSHIIRTGVRKGYKLLYLPPGIKVHITGAENDFYKLRLGRGITGYTNIDSVTILPPGTELPKGRVSYITINEKDKYIDISCNTGAELPYEINESSEASSIDIDIFGVTGDVDWIRYNTSGDLVKIVKWSQPSDDIFRITVELSENSTGGYKAYYNDTNFIFRIRKNPKLRRWPYKAFKDTKIVVDPGHSHDSGAIGPTGLKEKDANLWIAHELREMLMENGAEVIMTRYGHEHIPLYDRPKIASRRDADILVSIHNNALPDGINPFENNGVSVYYYHPHSKALAEAIHARLVKGTKLPDHGLYYGNLVLTRPTEMPAVLVECAFMMIPEQEAMLKTDKYQRKCARAIMDGIKDYLKLSR